MGEFTFQQTGIYIVKKIETNYYIPAEYSTTDQRFIINGRDIPNINIIEREQEFEDTEYTELETYFTHPEQQWMETFTKPVIIDKLIEHEFTNHDSIILCSDGGMKDGSGSYGMVVSINGTIVANSKGRVPPTKNKMTPHRCESIGMLSAIITYRQINAFINKKYSGLIKIPIIVIYSDCEALINTLNDNKTKKVTTKFHYSADSDIIRQILQEYKELKTDRVITIFKHVRGHQDKIRRELTLAEQLNVEADLLATSALRLRNITMYDLPTRKATLIMDGKQITAQYTKTLRDSYTSINLQKHLKNANGWEESTMQKIWWKISGDAMTNRPTGEKMTLAKYLHNRLPCNRKQHRYYGYLSNKCLLCDNIEEFRDDRERYCK
jgi:hypothetical protein